MERTKEKLPVSKDTTLETWSLLMTAGYLLGMASRTDMPLDDWDKGFLQFASKALVQQARDKNPTEKIL